MDSWVRRFGRIFSLAFALVLVGCGTDSDDGAESDTGGDVQAGDGGDVGPLDSDNGDANTPPVWPSAIVLYHDSVTGAGWDVDALLATDPYDYPSQSGKLRDAIERFLQDGITRMTGVAPPIINSDDLEGQPPQSIVVVLFSDAPAVIQDDVSIQEALGRADGAQPDYVRDRESYYLKTLDGRTWVVANTVDGIVSAMPDLLGSVGYDVLGMGPNWIDVPDYTHRDLLFDLDEGHRNTGYYSRFVGGWGASGASSLVVQFELTPPDEDVTRSYARWRVGTRINAGQSVPFFTGDALESYADAVLAEMREQGRDDGFINSRSVYGAAAERPAAAAENADWLWIDTDDEATYWSNGLVWTASIPQGVGFNIDLSMDWVRQVLLELLIAQSNAEFWANPDDWSVFAAQPEDGGGYYGFADYMHNPQWYPDYRDAEGQVWEPYVLDGYLGISQEAERWDPGAVSDTVFANCNWLLREYDHWVDALPDADQTDPDVATQRTRTGRDRRQMIRCGLSSYNFNDVPPHFNLDPRIRLIVGGYAKNRGIGEWATVQSRQDVAGAMQLMIPDEPVANYATVSDWGWDPENMSYVLPHLWGNSSRSILDMYESFTAVGVRSWQAEMEMGYTQHALGLYLISRYMWDPSLTAAQLDAIRLDWLARAFGPGAAAMEAYFAVTEPATSADVPNFWGRAIDLINDADALIPDGSAYQLRLDDLKLFWYFYYLMDTGQLVNSNQLARELLWKDQSSYTICNYTFSWWVFFGQWLMDLDELFEPVNYTIGPAHYTPEEIAEWWALVDEHWSALPVDSFSELVLADGTVVSDIDLNDLVAIVEFASYESELSDALSYSAWSLPYTQVYSVAGAGDEIGFKLLWTAYDPPEAQTYWGPHDTRYTIDRWDAEQQAWVLAANGDEPSVRVADGDNFLASDAWFVEARYSTAVAGTYRTTVGYGGIGTLAGLDWDIGQSPIGLSEEHGFSFSQRLVVDAQPEDGGMYVYIPGGVTSLDFEMTDRNTSAAKTVTLYAGFPLSASTPTRTVDITEPGTHRIALEPGEDGAFARFNLGFAAFEIPYLYSIPQLWSRSPSALLVPRAVAVADGLTVLEGD